MSQKSLEKSPMSVHVSGEKTLKVVISVPAGAQYTVVGRRRGSLTHCPVVVL